MTHTNQSTPRLRDVADLAGVSYQTVSRVVNDHPQVTDQTRAKVQAAILKLGYRPNSAARSLITRRSRTIGVLGHQLFRYGSLRTILGLEQAAREVAYFVSVAEPRGVGRKAILDVAMHFLHQGVDGIVVTAPHAETLVALEEVAQHVPIVSAGGACVNSSIPSAASDQHRGAQLAVEHLITRGHRRIGHLAGPQVCTDGVIRAEGWKAAMQSAGLAHGLLVEGDWTAGSGYSIGRQMARSRTVTAFLVANDQMALGLLRAFSEAKVRVPEDVSVVGLDDQPESRYFTPPLTTVRLDYEELGRKSMQVMMALLDDGKVPDGDVMKAELVTRKSTANPCDSLL